MERKAELNKEAISYQTLQIYTKRSWVSKVVCFLFTTHGKEKKNKLESNFVYANSRSSTGFLKYYFLGRQSYV